MALVNFYEVFNLENYSSSAEVKAQYQRMIRKVHPDKLHQHQSCNQSEKFIKLQEAWNVLGNSAKKKEYDVMLQQQELQQEFNISDTVCLCDFNKAADTECADYSLDCRCGGEYLLSGNEQTLDHQNVIVGCSNCSLYIEVIL